jgi:DNA invertase Pin-like site-specific DNA recombinase
MKRKFRYATARVAKITTVATCSNYINSIDDLKPSPVVLYLRVSSRSQKQNLPHQIARLRAEVEKRGCWVVDVFREIVPGWEDMYGEKWGRQAFERAIQRAKELNAVVVAESVSRFRRSFDPTWRKGDQQPPLSVAEIEALMAEAEGVRLATLVPPDSPLEEVRSYETKRGQGGKNRRGGRPAKVNEVSKKAKRHLLKPKAKALHSEGYSYRWIGIKLGAPWSTVRDWIKSEQKPHTISAS